MPWPPSIGQMCRRGRLVAVWQGHRVEITMSKAYDPSTLVWMRVFDALVPVLPVTALTGAESWMRRVPEWARSADATADHACRVAVPSDAAGNSGR